MAAHDGLSQEESADLNARLVLLLANLIGDIAIVNEAIEPGATHTPVTRRAVRASNTLAPEDGPASSGCTICWLEPQADGNLPCLPA